jgi:hypothetical protein
MARKPATQKKGLLRLHEVAGAVKRVFTRGRKATEEIQESRSSAAPQRQREAQPSSQPQRPPRLETDIPMDVIERAYVPHDTSSKASFRSDGSDHQRDQEFAMGVADDRWNDEDRLTNKSGDPRIGTHRRTYEPAESLAESRE